MRICRGLDACLYESVRENDEYVHRFEVSWLEPLITPARRSTLEVRVAVPAAAARAAIARGLERAAAFTPPHQAEAMRELVAWPHQPTRVAVTPALRGRGLAFSVLGPR